MGDAVTHDSGCFRVLVGRRGLEPRTYGLKVRSSTIELATRPDQATCTAYAAFAALTYQ